MARTRVVAAAAAAQNAEDEPPVEPEDDPEDDPDDDDPSDDDDEESETSNEDDPPEDQIVPPQGEADDPEDPIRNDMIAMYQRVLGFSPGAATALWEDQGITTLEHLRELTDALVDETCRAIQKPGGDERGYQIPIIARQRLKLLAFWARHLYRTSREPEDIINVTWDEMKHLTEQKTLEDNTKDGKDPPTPEMTLESANAAACFNQMRLHLRKIRSKTTGVPLEYVVRTTLKGPYDFPDAEEADPAPYGERDSPYVSIDHELVSRAPILDIAMSEAALRQSLAALESKGPFERSFIADSSTVYDILHTVWGKSSWWTHCKPFEKTKNGRQAFRTLHLQLLGGHRVVTTGDAIVLKIQGLVYDGDRRHFTFDKYVQLHIDQHNLHNDLSEYGVAPLAENMKILWFQQGIKDKSMEPIKATIVAQTSSPDNTTYTTFQAVQESYTAFYRQQTGSNTPRTRQVSSVRGGGGRGGGRSATGRSTQGRGPSRPRSEGVYTQAELDACRVDNKKYSGEEYKRLTPLQKQKLWLVRNPGKTPGQGPSRLFPSNPNRDPDRSSSTISSTGSTPSAGSKRTRDDHANDQEMPDADKKGDWGRNRNNPAIQGRQRKTEEIDD